MKMTKISDKKIKQIAFAFNNTAAGFPADKTIHQLFEEQVERTPGSAAVVEQRTEGRRALTYRELNEKANQLARLLREKGVGPDTTAAIMVERSLEMTIGIFGILKAGGAYMPIPPTSPAKRTARLLKDSGTKILLTRGKLPDQLKEIQPAAEVMDIDMENEDIYRGTASNLPVINKPGDLVYVIYTSGSTGTPKGVMIRHDSAVNRLHWMQKRYPLGPGDTILQKTPFFFDVSVWELFWWSMVGARMCFLAPGGEKFPQIIIDAVAKNEITVMHFVPSMLSVFLEYLRNSENDVKRLASLRQVFASGESLTSSHVRAFNDILYKTNLTRLTNLYGPTEATVDVSYFDCPGDGDLEQIPIGKPIDNTQLLIIGEGNCLQGIEETGELCIGGSGLARGYLNRPELTAEKFIGLPYSPTHPLTHSTIYRTGDLARWLPDGNIDFLGRKDHQVKIHGLRIELGEIEAMLSGHPSIRDSAVLVKKYSRNVTVIAAYIVPREELSAGVLKDYLKDVLPPYMVPHLFVFLDELPLTPTGKVDRKSLPEPAFR
jgi:amino acid adenylation domain-containing protein